MAEQAAKEPTMEEILASIRRIISEDGEPDSGVTVELADTSAPELTGFDDEAEDEAFPVDDLVSSEEDDNDGHLLSVDDLLGNDVDFSEIDELSDLEVESPAPVIAQEESTDLAAEFEDLNDFDDSLDNGFEASLDAAPAPISPELADTMEAVMAEPEPQAIPANDTNAFTPAASAGTGDALEGLVRELMAPMIKQWIDQNLPTLVEQRVEQEIQQIATKVVAALRD